MKPLFTDYEYQNSKYEEYLSCLCYNCKKPFNTFKKNITRELKHKIGINKFCSKKCQGEYQTNECTIEIKCSYCSKIKRIPFSAYNQSETGNHFCSRSCAATYRNIHRINKNSKKGNCKNCNCEIKIQNAVYKKSKTGNNFCSRSCAATYNNTHKTTGNRRSKLEKYLESELIQLYPNLGIHFNRKDAINSELDIYIPSLNLAFELNGIFHYEPIFGGEKLLKTQNNDKRKFQACYENNIELCIIDTSTLSYFKEHNALKYLGIITNIINDKLNNI